MNNYFIHPQALVETKTIGEKSKIWAFVHILQGAAIGKNANICDHCFIESKVIIGDNVTMKSGVYLWDGITIEDNVFIGPAAAFTNDLHPRSKNTKYHQLQTLIKHGASIGANATILPGITIGAYAMVGAGAVVTKNVPDYTLVYGNPAEIKSYMCACTEEIDLTKKIFTCLCGKKYTTENKTIKLIL